MVWPLTISTEDLDWLMQPIDDHLGLPNHEVECLKTPPDPYKPITLMVHILALSIEELTTYPGMYGTTVKQIADVFRNKNSDFQLPAYIDDSPVLPTQILDKHVAVRLRQYLLNNAIVNLNTAIASDDTAEITPGILRLPLKLTTDQFEELCRDINHLKIAPSARDGLRNPDPDPDKGPNRPINRIIDLLFTNKKFIQFRCPQAGTQAIKLMDEHLQRIHPDLCIPASTEDPHIASDFRDIEDTGALKTELIRLGLLLITDPRPAPRLANLASPVMGPASTDPDPYGHLSAGAYAAAAGRGHGADNRTARQVTGGSLPIRHNRVKRTPTGRRSGPGRNGPR